MTVTLRFRWWTRPATTVIRTLVMALCLVTPRAWHNRIVKGAADLLAGLLTRYAIVIE